MAAYQNVIWHIFDFRLTWVSWWMCRPLARDLSGPSRAARAGLGLAGQFLGQSVDSRPIQAMT